MTWTWTQQHYFTVVLPNQPLSQDSAAKAPLSLLLRKICTWNEFSAKPTESYYKESRKGEKHGWSSQTLPSWKNFPPHHHRLLQHWNLEVYHCQLHLLLILLSIRWWKKKSSIPSKQRREYEFIILSLRIPRVRSEERGACYQCCNKWFFYKSFFSHRTLWITFLSYEGKSSVVICRYWATVYEPRCVYGSAQHPKSWRKHHKTKEFLSHNHNQHHSRISSTIIIISQQQQTHTPTMLPISEISLPFSQPRNSSTVANHPNENGVICKRDKEFFNHSGNRRFRSILASRADEYNQA